MRGQSMSFLAQNLLHVIEPCDPVCTSVRAYNAAVSSQDQLNFGNVICT